MNVQNLPIIISNLCNNEFMNDIVKLDHLTGGECVNNIG